MAQRALPPGTPQRRAFFGLLDADGWGVAFWKALFWFGLIILLLGYLPDRAYYFTVLPTLDLGYNAISPINLCDSSNGGLPCPAPNGAVVPWQPNPPALALPAPRAGAATVQLGTQLFVVGGTVGGVPTGSVLQTTTGPNGNYGRWIDGPQLPEARADAAVTTFNGVPYVIGGLGADGKPTTSVIVGQVSEGKLTGWKVDDQRKLPVALAGAAAVAATSGIYIVGGKSPDGLSSAVYWARLDSTAKPATLRDFAPQPALQLRLGTGEPAPRAYGAGLLAGQYVWLLGGDASDGPSNLVFRLQLDSKGEPYLNAQGQVVGWAQSTGAAALPQARARFGGFTANGALYVPGGIGADGKTVTTMYWAVPGATTGDIAFWQHLDQTDLGLAAADQASAVVGSYAFLIGGRGADGTALDGTARANLAPKAPFFRLGLVGVTIPALAIQGQVGQQLGLIAAGTVGLADFTLLIIIGIVLSHQPQSQRLLERLSRGRYRAPREDEYFGA